MSVSYRPPATGTASPAAALPGGPRPGRPPGRLTRRATGLLIRLLVLAGSVGAVAVWWLGVSRSVLATPGAALTSFSELTGLLAGFLICPLILLVARVPWFERAVGLDRLVAWHRVLGPAVLLLTVTHVVTVVLGGSLTDRLTVWSELFTVTLTEPDVLTATIGTVVLVLVGLTSLPRVRERISYEIWYGVHVASYVAIFLTFGHQIHAGVDFVEAPLKQLVWTVLYLATAAAVVVWRVLRPLHQLTRHRVRVHAVIRETPSSASVWLSGRDLDALDARPGQFVLLRFLTPRHLPTAHPYSLSALPHGNLMRVTVGALGDHSTAVVDLRPGTGVLLEGPFGTMTDAEARPGVGVLLVAGGVGIGPIATLAHRFVAEGRDVVLLHRASSAEELPLWPELATQPLRYQPLIGRRRVLGYDPLSAPSLHRLVPDVRLRDVFVCGSPGMAETVTDGLTQLMVPARHIHREELSLS